MGAERNHPDDFAARLVGELKENFRDGASVMARHAVALVGRYVDESRDSADAVKHLPAFIDRLGAARPSMYAIARVMQEWRMLFDAAPGRDRESIERVSKLVLEKLSEATRQTALAAGAELQNWSRILTHSASSTVQLAVEAMGSKAISVVATESLPGREGRRLAQALMDSGTPCEVIADEEAAGRIGDVDALVVGADAVLENGSVVNKTGTRTLAEIAHERGVPVIVIAESFKNAPGDVPLENAPDGNEPLFDITPARLITQRIGDDVFTTE